MSATGSRVAEWRAAWTATRLSAPSAGTIAVGAIAGGALVVRLAYWAAVAPGLVIDNDGADYARAAQNLLHGAGLLGIRGGTLDFPPLYSLLIAALIPFTHDGELAGRVISLVAGTALPVAMYFAVKPLFGRAVATLAALVCAFTPVLIGLSVAVLTDQSYATLLVAGLALALRAARGAAWRDAALAGCCFGIAYLLRPEALVEGAALAVTLFVLVAARRGFARGAAAGVAMAAALIVVALPYVVVISLEFGKLTLETKSAVNYEIGVGLAQGKSYEASALALGDGLQAYGRELNDAVALPQPTFRQHLAFAGAAAVPQARNLLYMLRQRDALTLVAFPFLILGVVRSWRGRDRIRLQALPLALWCTSFLALVSVMQFWERYGVPFLVLAVPWVAKGAYDAAVFAARRFPRLRPARRAGWAVATGALALWAVSVGIPQVAAARHGAPVEQVAGLWLRAHDVVPGSVMTRSTIVPYYAGRTMAALPYAVSPSLVLRYVTRMQPRYIALFQHDAEDAPLPYLAAWMAGGIPDARARLVFTAASKYLGKVQVYRWK